VLARGLALLLALCALLIGGCTDDEGSGGTTLSDVQGITRQIAGRWTGALHQKGLPPFKAAVDIGADGNGHVAYTGIRCGGDWTLDRVQQPPPPDYLFREEIKEGVGGSCKGTGIVTLAPIQSNAPNSPAYNELNYSFTGGGVNSRGLLRRTDIAHLMPLFKRAGVAPTG
jgi:hypothetical protein